MDQKADLAAQQQIIDAVAQLSRDVAHLRALHLGLRRTFMLIQRARVAYAESLELLEGVAAGRPRRGEASSSREAAP